MTDPWFNAQIDQAAACVRDMRKDKHAAHAEQRCVAPPTGCGRPIPSLATGFRDYASRAEYDVTGLCQACQDVFFAPSPEEIAEMAADPEHYGRCQECGEYREYEFVDVGVGVIKGFDCCRYESQEDRPPLCLAVSDSGVKCWLGRDHFHGHDWGTVA